MRYYQLGNPIKGWLFIAVCGGGARIAFWHAKWGTTPKSFGTTILQDTGPILITPIILDRPRASETIR